VRCIGLAYDSGFVNTEAEILAQVKNLLREQRRGPDIRNAAVFAWRHIIDRYGGQAEESYFINAIQNMALYRQATILEPAELFDEWKKAGWIEYSPNGSEIRITSVGVEQLNRWETDSLLIQSFDLSVNLGERRRCVVSVSSFVSCFSLHTFFVLLFCRFIRHWNWSTGGGANWQREGAK
jgi:hypothetical protein